VGSVEIIINYNKLKVNEYNYFGSNFLFFPEQLFSNKVKYSSQSCMEFGYLACSLYTIIPTARYPVLFAQSLAA